VSITEAVSDARLLGRFASRRDEAAFRELVHRHGGRVLQVCRSILRDEHDVDDAFQATFLVLAHKAGQVAWAGSVSAWIAEVARRQAVRARSGLNRRRSRERLMSSVAAVRPGECIGWLPEDDHPHADHADELEHRDLGRVLNAALHELPEKYRAPIVLCYFEGKTNEEAARQLGWPSGSMSRRLEHARSLLRRSLASSGVLMTIGLVAAAAAAWGWAKPRPVPVSPTRAAVREVMQAFRESSPGQKSHEALLWEISRGDRPPENREQLASLARIAESAAARTVALNPGHDQGRWLFAASEMRIAAIDLDRAVSTGNQEMILRTARQLNATCVACHQVFNQ
jgi:RNA polymerase sigma-70 factor (ECF subfamily)